MAEAPEDKRKATRVPVDFEVRFTFENKENVARALNLSLDGMFLRTDYMLLQDDIIDVYFKLPNSSELIEASARVAWGTRVDTQQSPVSGMGIQFLDLDPLKKTALENYLRQLLKS
jgi:uncharacterized protein (TIGR02266 family)